MAGLKCVAALPSINSIACTSRGSGPACRPSAFVVPESERTIKGETSVEQRLYITSLAPDAAKISSAIRSPWVIENRLHGCMDVVFSDDQMRARTGHAAHNLAVLKHITLNLIRFDPFKRKGGIKARRFIAAVADLYRAQLPGWA